MLQQCQQQIIYWLRNNSLLYKYYLKCMPSGISLKNNLLLQKYYLKCSASGIYQNQFTCIQILFKMQCIWYILEPINFNICKYHLKYSASTGSGSATLLRTQCTYMHHFKSLALIDSLQYIIHYLKCTPRHFCLALNHYSAGPFLNAEFAFVAHQQDCTLLKVFIS